MTGITVVTGASGFAGSHLLDRLAGRTGLEGWHRPGKSSPTTWRDVSWQAVDLLDHENVASAIARTRPVRIYHIAGAPNVDEAWRNVLPHLQTNVLGTHHLLRAVRNLGSPCRVLVVSSAMIYKASDDPVDEQAPLIPSTPYGVSKLAQDQLALRSASEDHLDVVVARPFNHAGPRQDPGFIVSSLARQIARIEAGLDEPRVTVGNLDAERDFTDVRDVVEAYEHLMETAHTGTPYNVCSGKATRIGDLLDRMLALTRVKVEVIVDRSRFRPSDVRRLVGDPGRIRQELGWRPHVPIDRTIKETLDWWRSRR